MTAPSAPSTLALLASTYESDDDDSSSSPASPSSSPSLPVTDSACGSHLGPTTKKKKRGYIIGWIERLKTADPASLPQPPAARRICKKAKQIPQRKQNYLVPPALQEIMREYLPQLQELDSSLQRLSSDGQLTKGCVFRPTTGSSSQCGQFAWRKSKSAELHSVRYPYLKGDPLLTCDEPCLCDKHAQLRLRRRRMWFSAPVNREDDGVVTREQIRLRIECYETISTPGHDETVLTPGSSRHIRSASLL
jgi:hypothetical protein